MLVSIVWCLCGCFTLFPTYSRVQSHPPHQSPTRYSLPPSYATAREGGERLSEWDLLRGRQLFDQYDTNGNGFLSRDEFENVVQDLEEEGYMLRDGEEAALAALLTALDSNGDGKISWPEFEKGLAGEAADAATGKPLRALRWRCLSGDEACARSEELYVCLFVRPSVRLFVH